LPEGARDPVSLLLPEPSAQSLDGLVRGHWHRLGGQDLVPQQTWFPSRVAHLPKTIQRAIEGRTGRPCDGGTRSRHRRRFGRLGGRGFGRRRSRFLLGALRPAGLRRIAGGSRRIRRFGRGFFGGG
jgi:hypothetical protein